MDDSISSYILRIKNASKFDFISKTGRVDSISYPQSKDDIKNDEQTIQFVACKKEVNHNAVGSMNDIQKELSHMTNVLQDAVKKQKCTPINVKLIRTFIDHPDLDNRDSIRDKMKNVAEIRIPEIRLKEINDKFESEGKRKLKDVKRIEYEPNYPDGQKKQYVFEVGDTVDDFDGKISNPQQSTEE